MLFWLSLSNCQLFCLHDVLPSMSFVSTRGKCSHNLRPAILYLLCLADIPFESEVAVTERGGGDLF